MRTTRNRNIGRILDMSRWKDAVWFKRCCQTTLHLKIPLTKGKTFIFSRHSSIPSNFFHRKLMVIASRQRVSVYLHFHISNYNLQVDCVY